MKKKIISLFLCIVNPLMSAPLSVIVDTKAEAIRNAAQKNTISLAIKSQTVQDRENQAVRDQVSALSQLADEARKNVRAFAIEYGFLDASGNINTAALLQDVKTVEQNIKQKAAALQPGQQQELINQVTSHIEALNTAIKRHIESITPIKQVLATPLDEAVKTIGNMAEIANIADMARKYGFVHPNGIVQSQGLLDALNKMEQTAREEAGKISAQKRDEIIKIIAPQLESLRNKIQQYRSTNPEPVAPTTHRSTEPMATVITPQPTVPSLPVPQPSTPVIPVVPTPTQPSMPPVQPVPSTPVTPTVPTQPITPVIPPVPVPPVTDTTKIDQDRIEELKKLSLPDVANVDALVTALRARFNDSDQEAAIMFLSTKPMQTLSTEEKNILRKLLTAKVRRVSPATATLVQEQIKALQ